MREHAPRPSAAPASEHALQPSAHEQAAWPSMHPRRAPRETAPRLCAAPSIVGSTRLCVPGVTEWTYTDVEHYVCTRMLGLCMREAEEEDEAHAQARSALALAAEADGAPAQVNSGVAAQKQGVQLKRFASRDFLRAEQASFNRGLERAQRLAQREL